MIGRTHPLFGYFGWAFCMSDLGMSKDSPETQESISEQQVAGQGGGSGSNTVVAGAGSRAAGASDQAGANITAGKNATIEISNPDPDAIAGIASVASTALNDAATATLGSETEAEFLGGGAEQIANSAIQNANTAITDVASASNGALDVVGNNATALEDIASNYEQGLLDAESTAATVANNATTGNTQPIQYEQLPTVAQQSGNTTLATWGWIITICAGLAALYFYFVEGKK